MKNLKAKIQDLLDKSIGIRNIQRSLGVSFKDVISAHNEAKKKKIKVIQSAQARD